MTGGFTEYPGVTTPEYDISQIIRESAPVVMAFAGAAERGPIGDRPILLTDTRAAVSLMGRPNVKYGYGLYCALHTLEEADQVYFRRVVNGALHSAVHINVATASTPSTPVGGGLVNPEQVDETSVVDETIGTGDGSTLAVSAVLASFNDVTDLTAIKINGVSIGTLAVDKGVSPWTISGGSLDGSSSTLNPDNGAIQLNFSAGNAPASGADISVDYSYLYEDTLFTIVAENPGAWGNGLRVSIGEIDTDDSTFSILVEEIQNGVPITRETHTVSRIAQQDLRGRQLYLEDVINGRSQFIRVIDNLNHDESIMPQVTTSAALTRGDDGAPVTEAQIIQEFQKYSNRNDLVIDAMINAGYVTSTSAAVHQAMTAIAESRDDCLAFLDAPYDELAMSPTTRLVDWRNNVQNNSSSYAGLYAPWPEVYDTYNDIRDLPVPPSGFAAQVYVRTAKQIQPWAAPAGMDTGIIQSTVTPVVRLTHEYDEGQQAQLYKNQVNYLMTHPGEGIAVWGQKTLQKKASATDRLNVRILLNVIKRTSRQFMKYKLFKLNTSALRREVTEAFRSYLDGVVAREGLYAYRVQCDDKNNSGQVIDENKLVVTLYLQPTKSAEFIKVESVITRTGVDLSVDLVATAA